MRAQVHLQSLCSEAEGEDVGLIGRLRQEERSEERGGRSNRELPTLPGRDPGRSGFALRRRRLRLSPEVTRRSRVSVLLEDGGASTSLRNTKKICDHHPKLPHLIGGLSRMASAL